MTRTLPFHQNLEQFEQEARNLLHNLRRKDAGATQKYFSFDPLAGHCQPGLADAKYIVGFKSWQDLKQGVHAAEKNLVGTALLYP